MNVVLTENEVKERLKLGKSQARALMRHEEFPSYSVGSKYYITEEKLEEWLSNVSGVKLKYRGE